MSQFTQAEKTARVADAQALLTALQAIDPVPAVNPLQATVDAQAAQIVALTASLASRTTERDAALSKNGSGLIHGNSSRTLEPRDAA